MAISIEQLRDEVASATNGASVARAGINRARRWREKLRTEAKCAGTMFNVARFSLLVKGFPERIEPLGIFRDGEWHRENGLAFPNPNGQRETVKAVLEELDIGEAPGSVETVIDHVGWDMASLGKDLVAAAELLPDHVVAAFFHRGVEDMAVVFGTDHASLPFDQIADAARLLEVSFEREDDEPFSKLAAFANPVDLPYLKALVARGVVADGTTMVASAQYQDLEVVDALLELGVSINSVAGRHGKTALHVAVTAALEPYRSEESIAFAYGLLKRGIDIESRDEKGSKPSDLLAAGIDGAYATGQSERLDMMLVEELLTVLQRGMATTAI
jgi:hypothetical protein